MQRLNIATGTDTEEDTAAFEEKDAFAMSTIPLFLADAETQRSVGVMADH